jgi:hypothetical protein
MSGDGGNPPSLRDLLGAYEKSGLGDWPIFKDETCFSFTNFQFFGMVSSQSISVFLYSE